MKNRLPQPHQKKGQARYWPFNFNSAPCSTLAALGALLASVVMGCLLGGAHAHPTAEVDDNTNLTPLALEAPKPSSPRELQNVLLLRSQGGDGITKGKQPWRPPTPKEPPSFQENGLLGTELWPVGPGASGDNSGPDGARQILGEWRGQVDLYDKLEGEGEGDTSPLSMGISPFVSKQDGGWDGRLSYALDTVPLTLAFDYSHQFYTLRHYQGNTDGEDLVESLTPSLRWNVLEGDSGWWDIEGAFEWNNYDTRAAGKSYSRDRLRVLRVQTEAEFQDPLKGQNHGLLEWRIGLDTPGALIGPDSQDATPNADTSYQVVYGEYQRVQPFWWGSQWLFQGEFSIGNQNLLLVEKTYMGGPYSIRGFGEGDLNGDRGYWSSLEWRIPLWKNKGADRPNHPIYRWLPVDGLWWGIFIDHGMSHDPDFEDAIQWGVGVGTGLRIPLLHNRLVLRGDFAYPIVQQAMGHDGRVPWFYLVLEYPLGKTTRSGNKPTGP